MDAPLRHMDPTAVNNLSFNFLGNAIAGKVGTEIMIKRNLFYVKITHPKKLDSLFRCATSNPPSRAVAYIVKKNLHDSNSMP